MSTDSSRQQAVTTSSSRFEAFIQTAASTKLILLHRIPLVSRSLASIFMRCRISPANQLQSFEFFPKRQKMGSIDSESTLANETATSTTTSERVSLSVASEDLSSMMFHVADLQRVANSWAALHPLTGTESEMKASFKACEDTANSLRNTLESLEFNAASLASIQDLEIASSNLHNSLEGDKDGVVCPAYRIKFVAFLD
jgi:hypothetical protein